MSFVRLRMIRDYNRGLAWPIRTAHLLLALMATPFRPAWRWASVPERRWWARVVLIAALSTAILLPLDGHISGFVTTIDLRGDALRVFNWFGEYGQGGMVILLVVIVALMDRRNTRRLLDFGLATLLASCVSLPTKMLVARPRPWFDDRGLYDHLSFLGPWGAHPFGPKVGVRHGWEFWVSGISDIWSMPSSHTVHAVVMSVWLALIYPKLRRLAVVLAVVVALARINFGSHYPSDVVVGAAIGFLVTYPCVKNLWGVRLLDWAWQLLVDPNAPPAAKNYRTPPESPGR